MHVISPIEISGAGSCFTIGIHGRLHVHCTHKPRPIDFDLDGWIKLKSFN